MSTKKTRDNAPGIRQPHAEAWIPGIIPALKARWTGHFSDLPATQSPPRLNDWLTLLHLAATTPWKISAQLSQLFEPPKGSVELQNSWVRLTNLFAFTFEAIQSSAGQLDSSAWQSMLEIQNRILKQAAHVLVIKEDRPDTAALTRRALYLQTVTELNKKIVDIWDSNELLDEVVAVIHRNFGYEYVNLFCLDQATQSLTLRSAIWKGQRPNLEEHNSFEVDPEGIVSRVAATGRMMRVNDVAQNPSFVPHPALPDVKAQLAIPLILGNNLVGVLDFDSDRPYAFAEDDRQIGQALADHVAVAMENARLQTALQRHLREKTLLYESNLALGTSLDMDTVLNLMAQRISEVLEAGACVICRVDRKAQTTTALAQYILRYPGNPRRIWRNLGVSMRFSKDSIGHQVLKTARPVIGRVNHHKAGQASDKPPAWSLKGPETGRRQSWGAVLALPLESEDRIIGLIEIYDKNPNRNFSADDLQISRILATQTALAMERARLFDETRQRLSEVATLYTMAQELSGKLDLQAVLDTIVVTMRQAIGCRGCCIFLIDQTSQQMEIRAADGLKPQWRKMARLRVGEGAAGLAAAEARTVYLPDTHKEPDFIFFDETVRSLLVIPLFAHGEVIGAINLDDSQPDAFGPEQERLLTIAATQAGIVIENARLFARVSAEQQQTQAIIQYMADGLLLIDSEGNIITCNQTLAMMLGLHPGQITGQNIMSSHLHPNLSSVTATTTRQARTGVLAREVTIKSPRPRTLQVFSTAMFDDNHKPIGEVRVVHDITKERELDQIKDDFFSTISHELRTPLFSIQGFAQILLEEKDLDADTQTEFLATIQRQTAQLAEMVNNLLDLSKFDEGKLEFDMQPVVITDLIHQTMLKLQGFAHRQKVHLVSNLPPLLPAISGDKQRLEQVLTNLIGNAIKFSEAEGQVFVSATKAENEITVKVKDNGIGIPPEAVGQIFSRYYQVDHKSPRSAMGTGLGLHIAHKIVEGHGGRIWAESESGRGSTFQFTLPLPDTPQD